MPGFQADHGVTSNRNIAYGAKRTEAAVVSPASCCCLHRSSARVACWPWAWDLGPLVLCVVRRHCALKQGMQLQRSQCEDITHMGIHKDTTHNLHRDRNQNQKNQKKTP